ncbi:MAG: ATP-binding protein [Bacteroidota bacterium]
MFILLSIIPIACKNRKLFDDENSLKNQVNLIDSIKTLDSLSLCYRIKDKKLALLYARKCMSLANRMNTPEALATALNALGNAHNSSRTDSSFFYYHKAVHLADHFKVYKKKPQILLNLAMIYSDASNFLKAASLVDSAITLAENNHQPGVVADAYNALGLIRLGEYDSLGAKQAFEKAFEIGKNNHLGRQCGNALANISLYERKPVVSAKYLHHAMQYYHGLPGTEEEVASVNINLGNKQSVPDSAIHYYITALRIAESASIAKVAIAAYNNLAYAYLDKKNISKAEWCMESAIPLAVTSGDIDWLATLYDSYADVLIAGNQTAKALDYQKKAYGSRVLADSRRSGLQVKLLSSMLDLRAKDMMIRDQEIDLNLKQSENRFLKVLLFTFFITIASLTFLLLWLKQRARLIRARDQVNAALKIIELEEMEKRRLGFELHDHTGYLVRTIDQFITGYHFTDPKEKEDISAKISELRTSIRRFSHHLNPIHVQDEQFPDLLADLVKDFSLVTGIKVKYFIPASFPKLADNQLLHMVRIVQELLTNASKHAAASNVSIMVSIADQKLVLMYEDDGPGFIVESTGAKSFGFQSIRERIRLMDGKCKLESQPGAGTKWEFLIPQ